jgi:hypothetical protein
MSKFRAVGWADVATKSDVGHLGAEVRAEMRTLSADLLAELHQSLASIQRWMVTALIATGGTLFAALRLTGTS